MMQYRLIIEQDDMNAFEHGFLLNTLAKKSFVEWLIDKVWQIFQMPVRHER